MKGICFASLINAVTTTRQLPFYYRELRADAVSVFPAHF
jgi:hypothetical protein